MLKFFLKFQLLKKILFYLISTKAFKTILLPFVIKAIKTKYKKNEGISSNQKRILTNSKSGNAKGIGKFIYRFLISKIGRKFS